MEPTRTRATSLFIAVSAGLCASSWCGGLARAGAACPPAAVVEGAAEIVTPIAEVLRRRGVRSQPSECGRVVRASLALRPDLKTYSLHIEDGYGRVSDREIGDASTAASLIESWAIGEDADVLAPRAAPAVLETVAEAPPVPLATETPRWRVTTAGELSTATDGSIWYGGALAVCARIGPICAGTRGGIARDGGGGGGGGDNRDPSGYVSRTRIGAGVTAALPLSRGAFTFAPVLGLGLHWTRSEINPPIPNAQVPIPIDFSVVDLSLGAEVGVGAARAISDHWSVVADLGGLFAFPVSGRSGDPRSSFLPLPPRGFVHLGIGLHYAR